MIAQMGHHLNIEMHMSGGLGGCKAGLRAMTGGVRE
jgi:hypothetical protein